MRETFQPKTAGANRVENLPPFWRRMSMKHAMGLRLVQRRLIWCPTWLGAFCLLVLLAAPVVWWGVWGEAFLSASCRLPAEVLVVEGWVGEEGVRVAAAEFRQHEYRYIVASGGIVVTNRFGRKRELDHYSRNILCADPDLPSLVAAIRDATALAGDPESRAANFARSGLERDWAVSMAPALERLVSWAGA